jgi:predicted O-methyltransferase YrrM
MVRSSSSGLLSLAYADHEIVSIVLFRGLVPKAMENTFDPKDKNLMKTARKLHLFNQHVKDDPRVEQIILPLFDGLSIIQKKPKLSCVLSQV